MEPDLINKSLHEIHSFFSEIQRFSSSYSYQQDETEIHDASEQIISPSEISLPSFGSAFRDKFTFYNVSADHKHSTQDQLRDNHMSDTPLIDNYSSNSMCSSPTMSIISERKQESLDRYSKNIYPNSTAGTDDSSNDDCIDKTAMQSEVDPGIFLQKINSFDKIKSHESDQTKSFKNSGKSVPKLLDSPNSDLKCVMFIKKFIHGIRCLEINMDGKICKDNPKA
ncbi:hypothetical protein NPIL_385941 [Nephila pilipes]|uniref:Uncharacterized protein n=1 Tax=Nephila pilipes TaxID=299642 RepID=A0A8X6MN67_NEPPI|nr:hypothetical protein NPIL_385941 [Nephila pilipes]